MAGVGGEDGRRVVQGCGIGFFVVNYDLCSRRHWPRCVVDQDTAFLKKKDGRVGGLVVVLYLGNYCYCVVCYIIITKT